MIHTLDNLLNTYKGHDHFFSGAGQRLPTSSLPVEIKTKAKLRSGTAQSHRFRIAGWIAVAFDLQRFNSGSLTPDDSFNAGYRNADCDRHRIAECLYTICSWQI